MLICTCRYGYTRNNHAMPADAYIKVKEFIPRMYKIDHEYALYTLKQLCEECITEELNMHFYDGEDDEFSNRAASIDFIKWCLDFVNKKGTEAWFPYCYNSYIRNINLDDTPRYNVYEVKDGAEVLLTKEPVSVKKYLDYVFGDLKVGMYRKMQKDKNTTVYHLLDPVEKEIIVKHI